MPDTLSSVSPVDVLVWMVVVGSLLVGFWRGLIYEALALLNWVWAFAAGMTLSSTVGAWLGLSGNLAVFQNLVGFAIIFVIALFLGGWLASWIRSWVAHTRLRAADRALGALFGVARSALLLLILAIIVEYMDWRSHEVWQQAQTSAWLDVALDWIRAQVAVQ